MLATLNQCNTKKKSISFTDKTCRNEQKRFHLKNYCRSYWRTWSWFV